MTDDVQEISNLLVNSIMKGYTGDLRYIAWRYASSLRRLLLPILHRWGVGMCRHPIGNGLYLGGTLVYPWGNLTLKPEAHTDCYVWIAADGNYLETVDMTSSWGHEPSTVIYHGPVTREFVSDVGTIGDDLDVSAVLDSLPKYRAGDMGWGKVEDSKVPRTPRLLKGEVGDGINEPLSNKELQQWGMTATE